MNSLKYLLLLCGLVLMSCINKTDANKLSRDTPSQKELVTIMTLDPGHFHAALVQKSMYEEVNPKVYVYGPEGPDITDHINRIEGYNSRADNPTQWLEKVYKGPNYLQKMIEEKPGNVMVVSGKNNRKMDYINAAIDAGIHVYADKPMAINPEGFKVLEEVFKKAAEKDLMVYDIMTERF